jgi:hypothetical protein
MNEGSQIASGMESCQEFERLGECLMYCHGIDVQADGIGIFRTRLSRQRRQVLVHASGETPGRIARGFEDHR